MMFSNRSPFNAVKFNDIEAVIKYGFTYISQIVETNGNGSRVISDNVIRNVSRTPILYADISIPFRMEGTDISIEDTLENKVRFLAKRIGYRDHLPTYCGLLKKELVRHDIGAIVNYTGTNVRVIVGEEVIIV